MEARNIPHRCHFHIYLTKMDVFEASVVSFTALALVYFFMGVFMLIVSYKRKLGAQKDRMAIMQMWASGIFCVCMVGVIVTSILWLCGTFRKYFSKPFCNRMLMCAADDDFTSYTHPLEIFVGLGARSLICYEVIFESSP